VSIKTDLYIYLRDNPGVKAAVSDRIYPLRAPDTATLPYITIQRVTNGQEQQMLASADLSSPQFQIDCWASSSPSLESTSEAVRKALDGFTGQMIETDIRRISLTNETDDVEFLEDGSDQFVYRDTMQFEVWYKRGSVPTFP